MKEIKFRLWLKNYEENGGTMYYRCLPMGGWDKWWVAMLDEEPNGYDGEFELNTDCEVMQYTGKKDCEGKEIYDGDIIEFDRREWGGDDNIHVVSWDERDAAWSWGGGLTSDMCFRKVIGNIYENPELLETSKTEAKPTREAWGKK